MQTDLWLTESSNYDQCPLCGRLLKRGSQTCYACGFSVNSPSTAAVWIDPTVHAYQHVMPAQAGKQPNPTTPIPARASQRPTQQPLDSSPIWQYESPHYEAAGSLPMLSLIVPETPTQPQPQTTGKSTRRLPSIDEIDTVPPAQTAPGRDIGQVDAHPPLAGRAQRALMRVPQSTPAVQPIDSSSWTAGQARGSASAQLIASPAKRNYLPQALKVNPLDHTRWWLLRPGRIEFILWLGGTLLLIGVTCLLLLVSALSFQWSVPFASVSTNSANAIRDSKSPVVPGSSIALVGTGSLVPGQSFQLRGQGFKPSSQVTFYFDGRLRLFNQHGQPASTRTDSQGSFDTTLWLGKGSGWGSGKHSLIARDTAEHVATLDVMLIDNNSVANTTPVTSTTPGVTHTSTPTTPVSTPVNKPPASVTPTPSPSPTRTTPTVTPTPSPTHTTPTPISTAGTTPTATPTVGTTPSPTPGAVTPTPTISPTAATTGLGNSLNDSGVPPFAARLASVSPLVWLMVACYLLSMLFLGIAGVVHRRHR